MDNQGKFQKFLQKHNIKFIKFNLFDKKAIKEVQFYNCRIIVDGKDKSSTKKVFKQEEHNGLAHVKSRIFTINHSTLSQASQNHYLTIIHELCHILMGHDMEPVCLKELEAEWLSNRLIDKIYGYNNTDKYWLNYYNRVIKFKDRLRFIFRYWKRKKVYNILLQEFSDYDLDEVVIDHKTKYLH